MISQLPPESATATQIRIKARDNPTLGDLIADAAPHNPDDEQWSRLEHLVACVADELLVIRWQYLSAHSEKGKGPKWIPERIPRPGVAQSVTKPALQPEQSAMLRAHLARTQGKEVTYN